MFPRFASVLLTVSLALFSLPLMADSTLYDNGPVAPQGYGEFTIITYGHSVTDSLTAQGTVTGIALWAWLDPGETLTSVQVSIGSAPYGTDLFFGFVDTEQSNCFSSENRMLCEETASFSGPMLSGSAWLTLQNATTPDHGLVLWDENSGIGCQSQGCPSQAQTSQDGYGGTIPSEAFTVLGTSSSSTSGTTPEPGSLLLFGSAAIMLIGVYRRKLPR